MDRGGKSLEGHHLRLSAGGVPEVRWIASKFTTPHLAPIVNPSPLTASDPEISWRSLRMAALDQTKADSSYGDGYQSHPFNRHFVPPGFEGGHAWP
jgi:hypothetical protein